MSETEKDRADERSMDTLKEWRREEQITRAAVLSFQDVDALAREVLRLGERLEALEASHVHDQERFEFRLEAVEKAQTELYDSLADPAQPIQQGERIEGEEYEALRFVLELAIKSDHTTVAIDGSIFKSKDLLAKLPPGASLIVQPPEDEGEETEALPWVETLAPAPMRNASPPTDPEDAEREVFELMEHYYNEGRGGGPAPSPSDAREEVERIACAAWNRRASSDSGPSPEPEGERAEEDPRIGAWLSVVRACVDELQVGEPDAADGHPYSGYRKLWSYGSTGEESVVNFIRAAARALRASQGPGAGREEAVREDAGRERGRPTDEQRAAAFEVLRDALDGVRREPFPDITRHAAGCLDRVLASLEAGREREEAVERVAKWLYREQRSRTEWPIASKAVRESYRDDARRLLSECFPSPVRPAPDTEPEP